MSTAAAIEAERYVIKGKPEDYPQKVRILGHPVAIACGLVKTDKENEYQLWDVTTAEVVYPTKNLRLVGITGGTLDELEAWVTSRRGALLCKNAKRYEAVQKTKAPNVLYHISTFETATMTRLGYSVITFNENGKTTSQYYTTFDDFEAAVTGKQ